MNSPLAFTKWDARHEGSIQFIVVQVDTAANNPELSPINHHLQIQQGQKALPALAPTSLPLGSCASYGTEGCKDLLEPPPPQ